MALRIPHTSGGPVHWLQGRGYESFFSGVTAFTLDFTYKVHSYSQDQSNVLQMVVNNMFAFWTFNHSFQIGFSGVATGFGTALDEGLWHRIQASGTTNGGTLLILVDGNFADQRAFAAATTVTDPQGLLWIGPQNANDGDLFTHDFSIDQINGWNDRALTQPQLSSLAQGLTHASDYGVPAHRFRYDFNQQSPGTPTAINGPVGGGGDSGLYDLDGTMQGFWVTHGIPLWDNEVSSYTNNCVLDTPIVCTSGSTLEFTAKTALGVPMLLTYVPGQIPSTPAVSLNGGTPIYLSHDGTATSDRPLYIIDATNQLIINWKLPWEITPEDVVEVTVPAGIMKGSNGAPNIDYIFTAQNNTGIPRENFDGIVRLDHPRIGVVSAGMSYYTREMFYSNMIKNSDQWLWYGGNGFEWLTFDSLGNVTGATNITTSGGYPFIRLCWGSDLIEGIYTLLYKSGTPFLTCRGGFSEAQGGITLVEGETTLGGVHRKRYHIQAGTSLQVHSPTGTTDAIQLLDPYSVDSSGYAEKGMIHPLWQGFYNKGRCSMFRMLTAVNNTSGGFNYVGPDGWYSPWSGFILSTPLLTVTHLTGTDIPLHYQNFSYGYTYRFTCPAPHHFGTGQLVLFTNTGGTPGHGGLDGNPNFIIVVDSPTSFICNWYSPDAPAVPGDPWPLNATATITPSYSTTAANPSAFVSGMYCLDRVIQLCNDCGLDYYFTYPACWLDTDAAAHETYVAARLNPGLKCIREYLNEGWNSGSTVFGYLQSMGWGENFTVGDPGAQFYGQRAAQIILAGRNAWIAAGRDTDDFKGIMCWQAVSAGNARGICYQTAKDWWTSQGHPGEPFDYIGYAPYGGGELTPVGAINGNQRWADYMLGGPGGRITPGGVLDVLEQSIEGPYVQGCMKQYHDEFAPLGYRFGFYEWGNDYTMNDETVETGMPFQNYPGGNLAIMEVLAASLQHPRHNNVIIRTVNLAAQYDCDFMCYLGSTGYFVEKYGEAGQRWTMYQPNGDGQGNIGHLFDAIPPPPEANNSYVMAQINLTSSTIPALMITPAGAAADTTSTITMIGIDTVWSSHLPSTLFSLSSLTGCSLGVPTILSNTQATVDLTVGTTPGILTITDNSTGKVATLIVAPVDTTPPTVASAVIDVTGTQFTATFFEMGSPPVLPASGVTGLTLSATGGSVTLSSLGISGATCSGGLSRVVAYNEVVTLGYSPGNITDSAATPNAMVSFSGFSVTNTSTDGAPSTTTTPHPTTTTTTPHPTTTTTTLAPSPPSPPLPPGYYIREWTTIQVQVQAQVVSDTNFRCRLALRTNFGSTLLTDEITEDVVVYNVQWDYDPGLTSDQINRLYVEAFVDNISEGTSDTSVYLYAVEVVASYQDVFTGMIPPGPPPPPPVFNPITLIDPEGEVYSCGSLGGCSSLTGKLLGRLTIVNGTGSPYTVSFATDTKVSLRVFDTDVPTTEYTLTSSLPASTTRHYSVNSWVGSVSDPYPVEALSGDLVITVTQGTTVYQARLPWFYLGL